MDLQQFAHEDKRGFRFESAQVTARDGGVYGLSAAGATGWSEVGQAVDTDIPLGGSALILTTGDSQNPRVVGQDSWITG